MHTKLYRKKHLQPMRPVTDEEIELGRLIITTTTSRRAISVSKEDLQNGSPKKGDMIAINPSNANDQWLVSKEFFEANYEEA